MYVIIVGAGEVGSYLARILVEEDHDVAVVEADDRLAREIDATLDALVVRGSGVSRDALTQAGIKRADLVLAVTAVDEVNLVACMTAEKYGKNPRTVARVREAQYLQRGSALSAADLGVDLLIGPERAVADSVMELLRYEGSGEVRHLASGRLVLLGMILGPDSPLVHETLAQLGPDLPSDSLVVAVHSSEGLRIPRGDDSLRQDERAFILTKPESVDQFMILSGKPWHHVRNVLIVGCGNIGFFLAQQLDEQKIYPTIIEKEETRARWVASKLPRSLVLHGDGSDPDLLKQQLEEGEIDAVVVLAEESEKSLLIGLFAKSLGAKKVIVRCDKPAYTPLAHQLGVDALISPQRAVANAILRYVRKGRIGSTLMLGNHEGEIIELKVPDSPAHRSIIGKPLKDLSFPDGSLIGAVIRDDTAIVATGDTTILPGDDLLVVCLPRALHRVEKLFE